MKLIILHPPRLKKYAEKLADELFSHGYSASITTPDNVGGYEADVVIALGLDREILEILHRIPYDSTVIPVAPPSYSGYIALTPFSSCIEVVEKLSSGEVGSQRLPVLLAHIDGSSAVRALNEVAVFPKRSATLMEYDLSVNNDFIWHDVADGVIVATPLGSTAYAFSAGGPIALLDAEVLIIVPVNSMEPRRRSIVANSRSKIYIRNISSRVSIEVIADGVERIEVGEEVEIGVGGYINIASAEYRTTVLAKKKLSYEDLKDLPPSAKFVLRVIEDIGEVSISDIMELTGLSERTIRYAIALLSSRDLIEKIEDPVNPKRVLYRVSRRHRQIQAPR